MTENAVKKMWPKIQAQLGYRPRGYQGTVKLKMSPQGLRLSNEGHDQPYMSCFAYAVLGDI